MKMENSYLQSIIARFKSLPSWARIVVSTLLAAAVVISVVFGTSSCSTLSQIKGSYNKKSERKVTDSLSIEYLPSSLTFNTFTDYKPACAHDKTCARVSRVQSVVYSRVKTKGK